MIYLNLLIRISFFIEFCFLPYVKNLNIYESMISWQKQNALDSAQVPVRSSRSSLSFISSLVMRQRQRDVGIVQFSRKRGRLRSGRVSSKKHRANGALKRTDRINRYGRLCFRLILDSPRAEGEPRSPFIKARGAYRIFLTAMKALSPGRAEVLRFTFN